LSHRSTGVIGVTDTFVVLLFEGLGGTIVTAPTPPLFNGVIYGRTRPVLVGVALICVVPPPTTDAVTVLIPGKDKDGAGLEGAGAGVGEG